MLRKEKLGGRAGEWESTVQKRQWPLLVPLRLDCDKIDLPKTTQYNYPGNWKKIKGLTWFSIEGHSLNRSSEFSEERNSSRNTFTHHSCIYSDSILSFCLSKG